MSANSKDVIRINQKAESVRFMKITVLDAFREFDRRNPGLAERSVFYSLRPRNVKIISPHETCMCIYHENMHLLLMVREIYDAWLLNNPEFLIGMECRIQTKIGKHFTSTAKTFAVDDFVNKIICRMQTENCYIGDCNNCPTTQLANIFTEYIESDIDKECSWTVWSKLNNEFDLQKSNWLSQFSFE